MSYSVSYKGDNSGRRAIIDLIRWFGLRRSILIFRAMKACHCYADIDRVDMSICFGGVQGEPVRRLIARIHGEEVLQTWLKEPNGSRRVLHQAAYV